MASYLPQSAHPQEILFKSHEDGKYLGGEMEYTYGDNKQKMTTAREDANILARNSPTHLLPVVKNLLKGHTVSAATEIAGMLPYNSTLRATIQANTVATLFNSLDHPPASYLGDKHQYRTADGSHHNFLYPEFGQAGKPYAKTVRSAKKLHGAKPDPGLLFDYTSSYLDLAPLYGSNQAQQNAVRLMKDGLLKPDTFHEARLLGQPPGVNVLLVLYSRFHNYVATMLAEINEDGRFTLPENPSKKDIATRDNDIFQTARLIVGGLYINICLGDYLRAIQGVHEKDTTWNFDPRMEIEKTDKQAGVSRGMGNQVSCEFSLLYRFHSAISKDDADWTEDFFKKCLPADLQHKSLEELTVEDMHSMMNTFAKRAAPEEETVGCAKQASPKTKTGDSGAQTTGPEFREFGGLKRGPDGRFDDAELAAILKHKIDDPAGVFGAKHVPKALRVVEMAGIVAARKWEVASLNEFRTFFGMEPHKTFESINSDAKIADALRNLYDSPDMVEMYPGIFIEEISAGSEGIRFPPAAGRGVLSDAVTLVRSDRFYTLDYTTATLTNWGLCEAASDYKTLGGSMFHKLLHRGLPDYFDFNSVYAMQPMYTSAANEKIVKKLKTADQFSLNPPAVPVAQAKKEKHGEVSQLLQEKQYYAAWPQSSKIVAPDTVLAHYNSHQQNMLAEPIYKHTDPKAMFLDYVTHKAAAYLHRDSFELGKSWYQVDFIRDVAIPVNVRFLADLFCLNIQTTHNKNGVHSASELYKMLLEVRAWLDAPDPDHAAKWYKRRKAEEHTGPLTESTMASMAQLDPKTWTTSLVSLFGFGAEKPGQKPELLRDVGALIAKDICKQVENPKEAAHLLWLLAVSGVGSPVTAIAEVLEYYLSEPGSQHWRKITQLAKDDTPETNAKLEKYFLEAHRLTSAQLCKHVSSNQEEVLLLHIGTANRDDTTNKDGTVSGFTNPTDFRLDRKLDENMIIHGHGLRGRLGRDMFLAYGTSMLKVAARTEGLRMAPGKMGELKKVYVAGKRHYLTADWAYVVDEPTSEFFFFPLWWGGGLVGW
ncbi:MAG: hypothetical protein Q9210_003484 [Variospora velana]